MPSAALRGVPFFIMAISVVVPPISMIKLSFSFVRASPPITLAAGPQSRVSTGRCAANFSDIRLPSLLTMTTGAVIDLIFRADFVARMKSLMSGIRRAFSRMLVPLLMELRSENNSCPHTTGTAYSLTIRSRGVLVIGMRGNHQHAADDVQPIERQASLGRPRQLALRGYRRET